MSVVVALRPCICGKPGVARQAFVCDDPSDIARFQACDDCLDHTLKFLARVRPVFEAMIAVGVPSEIASETMQFLLDKIPDDSMMVPTDVDNTYSS